MGKEKKEMTPGEILDLPDWQADDRIYNFIRVSKDIEGKKTDFVFKVWIENEELKHQMDGGICLPPDTPMSYDCFQKIRKTGIMPDVSIKELFHELKNKQSEYIYAKDIHLTNLALKSIASFFLDVFTTFPYTDIFSPEFGSGKTTTMEVAAFSSYHGLVNTDPTAAVLYRVMEDVRCTIGIDEIDNLLRNKATSPNLIAIVNSSNIKGIPVTRINMEKGGRVEYYDAYGPKIFTRTKEMPPAWLSRSDQIPMTENRGRKDLKKYPRPKDFQKYRDMCYILRWNKMDKIRKIYQDLIDKRILVDRNCDVYLPILTIAKLVGEDVYKIVLNHAEEQWRKSSLRSKDILKEMLIRVLWENENFRNEIRVVDIRDAYNTKLLNEGLLGKDKEGNPYNYNSKKVINHLESFHFERSYKKTGHYVHFDINPAILEEWAELYQIQKSEEREDGEGSQGIPPWLETAFIPQESSLSSLSSFNLGPQEAVEKVHGVLLKAPGDGYSINDVRKKAKIPKKVISEIIEYFADSGRVVQVRKGFWRLSGQ